VNKHHLIRFKLIEVLNILQTSFWNNSAEEFIDTFPKMVMILDFLSYHHSIILSLKKIIFLVVNKIINCTLISACWSCWRIIKSFPVLAAHKCLREKLLVSQLNITNDIPHHFFELEFLLSFWLKCVVIRIIDIYIISNYRCLFKLFNLFFVLLTFYFGSYFTHCWDLCFDSLFSSKHIWKVTFLW
jgi:hypothetical protein